VKRAAEEHGGIAAGNTDMTLPDGSKPVDHSVPANTGYMRMMTWNPPPSFRALAAHKDYRPEGFKPEDASSSDTAILIRETATRICVLRTSRTIMTMTPAVQSGLPVPEYGDEDMLDASEDLHVPMSGDFVEPLTSPASSSLPLRCDSPPLLPDGLAVVPPSSPYTVFPPPSSPNVLYRPPSCFADPPFSFTVDDGSSRAFTPLPPPEEFADTFMDAAAAAASVSLDAVVPMIVSLVRSSSSSVEVLTDTVAGVVPLADRAELRRMVVTAVMTKRQFSAQLLELTRLAMQRPVWKNGVWRCGHRASAGVFASSMTMSPICCRYPSSSCQPD
jgi:hypothetical protein